MTRASITRTPDTLCQTEYGYLDAEGGEYVITRPDTPRPWVNVLCNDDPGYGCIISQAGSGYSWLGNAELNRITSWAQDLIQDRCGKYFYIRDSHSGDYWSAGYQPVRRPMDFYECRHAPGWTRITSEVSGIRSFVTCFVPPGEAAEVWLLEIENRSNTARSLSVTSYLEWALGTAHDTHREFHRSFLETEFVPASAAILARKRLWAIGNARGQGWNRKWEGTAFHACWPASIGFDSDKESFLGMYRGLECPLAMETGVLAGRSGRWGDAVASLQVALPDLAPGETCSVVFTIGRGASNEDALAIAARLTGLEEASQALESTRVWWRRQLSGFHAKTPDGALNALLNTWLRYQAVAGRIWGRSGYYQPGGAYGFRDQLQDSQVFLPTDPGRTRRRILLHAAHQFVAGNVYHWWQPITETGAFSKYSDDLLWMPFVVLSYLNETDDVRILRELAPYVDAAAEPLLQHCYRAIDLSLARFSERGLPLIGEGDWNDGLSAVGWDGKGESVWVAHFLCYLLPRWSEIAAREGDCERSSRYQARAEEIRDAVNRMAWDGEWYFRATCDDGTVLGSKSSPEGRIFLNAQVWAIIAGVCPEERREALMATVRRELYSEAGPVLLRPAYTVPDERIGYLTRYAPASRENGGVYVHAATWAIWAECLLGSAQTAWEAYQGISPLVRGQDPERYRAEPYVTAGNIDGPDSPNFGCGGWSWYTGSAGWLFRVMTEWVLGVRPERAGLRIAPCIPAHWPGYEVVRQFRGCTYRISVSRQSPPAPAARLDGQALPAGLVPPCGCGGTHDVVVEIV